MFTSTTTMPSSPALAAALAQSGLNASLAWPSAPLRDAVFARSKEGGGGGGDKDSTDDGDDEAAEPPDYFDDLPALDRWHQAYCKKGKHTQEHTHVQPGGGLMSRDELCETADAHKVEMKREGHEQDMPRLLVCHDFQGGYNDRPDARGYTFEHWSLTDIFIYFSHKRISLPPTGWKVAGQRHGVKMLGTVLFEWKEAMPELSLLLRGPADLYSPLSPPLRFSPYYIPALIDLALAKGIPGYLVNIELSLDLGFSVSGFTWFPDWLKPTTAAQKAELQRNARRLRAWVYLLRSEGRRRFAEAGLDPDEWMVLWYDSVTKDGHLQWQNAVTDKNISFFEVCDGIFTNYFWARPPQRAIEAPDMPGGPSPSQEALRLAAEEQAAREAKELQERYTQREIHPHLSHSVQMLDMARRRRGDAFVGIDVFGRGCWGGAQTWRSLEMISSQAYWGSRLGPVPGVSATPQHEKLGLSIALFAPGWTWEHAEPGALIEPAQDAAHSIETAQQLVQPSEQGQRRRTWHEFAELDRRFWTGGRSDVDARLSSPAAAEPDAFKQPISAFVPVRAPAWPVGGDHGILFHSTFARGSGTAWYVDGREVARWREPAASTGRSDPVTTSDDTTADEAVKKAREEDEERQARARVLFGWTDAGVSSPKADAILARPASVWLPDPGPRRRQSVAPICIPLDEAEEGPAVSVSAVEDEVWAGGCSIRVRGRASSSSSTISRTTTTQAAFVPLVWARVPKTDGWPEDEVLPTVLYGMVVLRLGSTPSVDVSVALRLMSGDVIRGSHQERQAAGSEWTRLFFTLHSSTSPRSMDMQLWPCFPAQAMLGLVVSGSTAQKAWEIHVGEMALGTAPLPCTRAVADRQEYPVRVIKKRDGLLALLEWDDFAPGAHWYEVFAARKAGDEVGAAESDRAMVWLGTATRERRRTEYVVPLEGLRAALGEGAPGPSSDASVTIVVRPHGSCWYRHLEARGAL